MSESRGSVDIPGERKERSPGSQPPGSHDLGENSDVSSEQLEHIADQNERIINLLTDIRNALEGGRR